MTHRLKTFVRLNIRNGPNVEQLVWELPVGKNSARIEFDLVHSYLNKKRALEAWVDLIFDRPGESKFTIPALTFSRYPRARL